MTCFTQKSFSVIKHKLHIKCLKSKVGHDQQTKQDIFKSISVVGSGVASPICGGGGGVKVKDPCLFFSIFLFSPIFSRFPPSFPRFSRFLAFFSLWGAGPLIPSSYATVLVEVTRIFHVPLCIYLFLVFCLFVCFFLIKFFFPFVRSPPCTIA